MTIHSADDVRVTLHFVTAKAEDWHGNVLTCDECGSHFDGYELRQIGRAPKKLLCCSKKSCPNGANATARILGATITGR